MQISYCIFARIRKLQAVKKEAGDYIIPKTDYAKDLFVRPRTAVIRYFM